MNDHFLLCETFPGLLKRALNLWFCNHRIIQRQVYFRLAKLSDSFITTKRTFKKTVRQFSFCDKSSDITSHQLWCLEPYSEPVQFCLGLWFVTYICVHWFFIEFWINGNIWMSTYFNGWLFWEKWVFCRICIFEENRHPHSFPIKSFDLI